MMRSPVMITDGHWRKSLAAVRALGREGVRVVVGESTRLATACFSRYCCRALVYPSPLQKPGGFVAHLLDILSRRPFQMLLPMEDETLRLVSEHRDEFSRHTYLSLPPPEKLNIARDKAEVIRLARSLGLPTPKTWLIEGPSQLRILAGRLPYPLVIKPRSASGALGISYVETADDLIEKYLATHKRFPRPLVQERIPRGGVGYGASFLMDDHQRVKAAFVHKRLREYPVTGGASTLRESVRQDDVRDMAHTLLKALDWVGVAMVEFKFDPRDGLPKLMEINPRFWGSLSLAVASGVNFPHLLYRMSRGEHFRPVENYRTGIRCRWLLPGDILHFFHNPERMKLKPSFFQLLDHRTSYDILSLDDPLPILGRLLTPLTFLYDGDMKHRLKMRRP